MLGEQSVWWFGRRTKALVTSDCNGFVKMDLVIWLVPLYAPKKNKTAVLDDSDYYDHVQDREPVVGACRSMTCFTPST